jgi:hypothetical protein
MFRVLTIIAAVVALAVTAAPASAASKVHGAQTSGCPGDETYLSLELENVQITGQRSSGCWPSTCRREPFVNERVTHLEHDASPGSCSDELTARIERRRLACHTVQGAIPPGR